MFYTCSDSNIYGSIHRGRTGAPWGGTPKEWPEWLSAREVVAYAWEKHRYFIKVPKTVRRWKNGAFPVAWQDEEIPTGSRLIFKRDDLDPFLESKKEERRKQSSNSEGDLGHPGADRDIQGHPGVPKGGQGHPGVDKASPVPSKVQEELDELRTKYEIAKVDVQVKDKLIEESEKRRREDATLYQESILQFAERLESTSKKLGRAEGELLRIEGETTDDKKGG